MAKFLSVYLIFVLALFYFFLNREMVFTSDLTGAKAFVLAEKAAKFGPDQMVYVDTIEEPLTLFYAGEPYTGVNFRDLKEIIGRKDGSTSLLFITKESRFLQIQAQYPAVELVSQQDEWVLGKAIKVSHPAAPIAAAK